MTTLIIVAGVSAGALAKLPKAGVWMVWVKRIFALTMIAVAEYYLILMGQVWI
jgi:cytochrome c-type biogenesis protein